MIITDFVIGTLRQKYRGFMRVFKNTVKFIALCMTLPAYSVVNGSAHAATTDSLHTQLAQASTQYLATQFANDSDSGIKTRLQPKAIDPRIHINACDWQFYVAPDDLRKRNVPIAVSCQASNWRIYVYVDVVQTLPVITATRLLTPDSVITPADVEVSYIDVSKLRRQAFATKEQVVGTKAKRRITAGTIIAGQNICYVCEGDAVKITASLSGLSIRTTGIAQEDGRLGQTIKVMNNRSQKMIYATVSDISSVNANM
jgi:flagella basal body P-ring formation protein FlgA